ncbi:MAG: 3-dehydroquinate synthase, partial [Betaproteobacteria bacterium]|nr:3-dehydroquinate synthase [Betaproteobacteria bacterium]
MRRLRVELGARSYDILIGPDLLAQDESWVALVAGRQVALVTNQLLATLHAPKLRAAIEPHAAKLIQIDLPDGERYKDWQHLQLIFDALLSHRFDRRCLLIAFGGGVVGDMTGFAAACYQRGVDFVQMPTTLLAQVDSSVGGKTGINHPAGKNMIGAFHQPKMVLADTSWLQSLPPRELSAGLAEVIKHGAIADRSYLEQVCRDMPALRRADPQALAAAVAGSCAIKAAVVGEDEREDDRRAVLNFGHTFGHAIEAGMGYGVVLHGEAVGTGMVMASALSQRLGLLTPAERELLLS